MAAKLTIYKAPDPDISGVRDWPGFYSGYKLIIYKPGLFSLAQYGTSALVNFLWYFTTRGRNIILVLLDNDIVAHYSYITPRVFRFPFMNKNDIQIGPCATHVDYQGKGLFTNVLKLIPNVYAGKGATVWTYTTLNDKAALKAFERAGYQFYAYATMSLKTKIVRIIS